MTTVLLGLNFGWMVALPAGLALYLRHRLGARWRFFLTGAAAFIAAQLLHIPFNWLLLQRWALLPADTGTWGARLALALFLGLSAGAFETGARLVCFRYWARDARRRLDGVMVGLGHGGIEAILLGLLGGINTLALLRIAGNDLLRATFGPNELALIDMQVGALAGMRWYELLMGGVERTLVLASHVALSLLVLRAVRTGRWRWAWLALAWHAALDALAVLFVLAGRLYWAELPVAFFALLGLLVIIRVRDLPPEVAAEPPPQEPPAPPARPEQPPSPSAEALDRSRYLS